MAPKGKRFFREANSVRGSDAAPPIEYETAAKKVFKMNRDAHQRASGILEAHIFRRYNDIEHKEAWRNLPEIPTSAEIMPKKAQDFTTEQWNDYQKDVLYDEHLPKNIIDEAWPSKEEYIGAHYQIHREDAIACLRKSVEQFKRRPGMMETQETAVYTEITFKGLLCAKAGIAFRIEFSTERSEKQIRWKQSKRLVAGTLVALSPHRDAFASICKVGIVAARPIEGGLDQNPPQVDIFWGDIDDAVFDPLDKYIMVESRTGYFEASRHMLVALQKLMTEKFHLANHITALDQDIQAPLFLLENPRMDLNSLVDLQAKIANGQAHDEASLENVDVLKGFPDIEPCSMDNSQMKACQSMLAKRLSIVQGPPGTGKTHVSVTALKVMIGNWVPGDPPIIITAQTNHALDQLLNHIMAFEKSVVRLGGRCDKDNEEILHRTLFELRASMADMKGAPSRGEAMAQTKRAYTSRVNDIKATLGPLTNNKILTSDLLLEHGIITQTQIDSLWEDGWGDDEAETKKADLAGWLTPDQLMMIPPTSPVNMGLDLEDTELDYEEIQELEGEARTDNREAEKDGLSGEWFGFCRTITGRSSPAMSSQKIKKWCAKKDLYNVPVPHRGEVYRAWEKELNNKMLRDLKEQMKEYQEISKRYEVARCMSNVKLINFLGIKVMACTTTGLSKYRALLAALEPKILLIEEAAETTEATVIAGMIDSLEQLVLVGDHQQLQANCNVRELGVEPYFLNVSMFERLVKNGISFTMLNTQRRMIREARELLTTGDEPFYNELNDHPSVRDRQVNRPPIPGMSGNDTWFFHHNWPEAKNNDGSSYNMYESEMLVGFYNYLVLNGTEPSKITVLTFYNGQRKYILKELKNHPSLKHYSRFKVHTVDSYQGEENDVILLSLVRSNDRMGIGFLENRNRAVVALSRARRGLYLFGNSLTLIVGEETEDFKGRPVLWSSIVRHMRDQGRLRIDHGMPLTCHKHGNTIYIREPLDWVGNAGGCTRRCGDKLPCGHLCPYSCHPFPHEEIVCPEPCPRKVPACGHNCSGTCGEACYCDQCKFENPVVELDADVDQYGNTAGSSGNGRRGGRFSRRSGFGASDVRQEGGYRHSTPARSAAIQGYLNPNISSDTEASPSSYAPNEGRAFKDNSFEGSPQNMSTPQEWRVWNAKAADKALYENSLKEQAERAARASVDPNSTIFTETFKQVKLNDAGRREKVGVERRVANVYVEENKLSFAKDSSAQVMADAFGVIPVPDGPNKFSSTLTTWERGESSSSSDFKGKGRESVSPTLKMRKPAENQSEEPTETRAPEDFLQDLLSGSSAFETLIPALTPAREDLIPDLLSGSSASKTLIPALCQGRLDLDLNESKEDLLINFD